MRVGEDMEGAGEELEEAGEELEELLAMLGPRDREKMDRLARVRSWQAGLHTCSLASWPAGDQSWQGLGGGERGGVAGCEGGQLQHTSPVPPGGAHGEVQGDQGTSPGLGI